MRKRAALERDDYARHPGGKCSRIFCLHAQCRPDWQRAESESVTSGANPTIQQRDIGPK